MSQKVTAEDLQKSLDKLEDYAASDDPVARKEALLSKAQEGDLEKAERDELFEILGGSTQSFETTTVGEELIKSMTDDSNRDIQDALDVSPYLREQNDALVKSLKDVGDYIEKSDKRQHEHFLMQSRALVDIGHLVKSMSERLGIIESQPVSGPKSKGITTDQALTKSFAGNEPDEGLSKAQISTALDEMYADSIEKGENGLTKSGEDMLVEISKFEQLNKLSPTMYGEVKNYLSRRNAAH